MEAYAAATEVGLLRDFDDCGEQTARLLDMDDQEGCLRDRFYIPPGTTYMDGNSLGLLSRDAEAAVRRVLGEWQTKAIGGWMEGDHPWFTIGERLGERLAPLVGAHPGEVVVTGTTTINIHTLVSSFYKPQGERNQILATALDFPSDIYALVGQLVNRHGRQGDDLLVRVPDRDGHLVEEDDILAHMTPRVAMAFLPSVLYRSGQLLDMERLTAVAMERGIVIGFDCAHSIGVIPHQLSGWGVDFALWCHYKYMNAGPGATAGLYVNGRHRDRFPGLPGWWGYVKQRQFDMVSQFDPEPGAGGFQISSPAVLSTAPLEGALDLIERAGLETVRRRSLGLTGYLMFLVDELLGNRGIGISTPREPARRGGHVALTHPRAQAIVKLLARRGVIGDFRHPDVVRLAPSPLYCTYHDVWTTVNRLVEVCDKLG